MLAGRGGGATTDFVGGCAARREAELRALGSGGEERQRGNEPASALASAGEGGRVDAGSGRGCRTAGNADAWSPRGEQALSRSGAARRVSEQSGAEAGQARRWAGLRRGARRGGRLAGPASTVGQKRGGGPRRRKSPFPFIVSRNF